MRSNHTHCFWHDTDSTAPANSIFHRAELNLPTDPIPAEENTAGRNYLTCPAMRAASRSIQRERPASVERPTTPSAYEHGQNAARRGKTPAAYADDLNATDHRAPLHEGSARWPVDAAHIGDIIISPGPLRGWNQGNPGMLV
jgi:hypothetical protein